MSKLPIVAFAIASQAAFIFRQPGVPMLRGTYRVLYVRSDQETNALVRSITFCDSTFIKVLADSSKIRGVISKSKNEQRNETTLYLYDVVIKKNLPGLNGLIASSFGPPAMELQESEKDTIPFRTTYARNLHITINEGILVREAKQ